MPPFVLLLDRGTGTIAERCVRQTARISRVVTAFAAAMTRRSDKSRSPSANTIQEEKVDTAHSLQARTLRNLLKQRKRRRLRKRIRILLNLVVCQMLPLLMLILGVVFCFVGALGHLHLLLSSGCVLLICSVGLILQSCFWSRSQPNKFTMNEILRVVAMEESQSDQKINEADGEVGKKEAKEEGEGREENTTESPRQPSRKSVGLLEVRRLSLAMTRVASELRHAANQNAVAMAPAGLAQGFSLGGHPTTIGPMGYGRGAINWYGNFSGSELTHIRRLSQWQNFT
ncbi:hypothetical protein ECG_05451 [Echinococcus granulosus]|uniref:Transmembrane protein n=1 Tax=Echinococcus granulosus TaxID=6210 RepID=U6J4Z2_ECHGR|nr:hypothetical protein EGR_03365 [Echinococcus granulosus]EUB61819.1 hypothetical protein EGR_03365 [Echinococcus granulosus]KAH9281341.1 hypothetical protein ECG_05452 [Echinococcus granulosus]KAH9281342.1 hypothetical protein ECG_05451 [Echinococcus granulosus]CDS18356.1 hypothetical protein EgrG_000613300 [Echinococcus granulosus]